MSLSELGPSHAFSHVTLSPPQRLSKLWFWGSLYSKGEGRLLCKLRQYDDILRRKDSVLWEEPGKVSLGGRGSELSLEGCWF